MRPVELDARVRHACHVEGPSRREAARRFAIDPKTVARMPRHAVPPGYRRTRPPPRPRLDALSAAIIDQIPAADRPAPPKQRHPAKRIPERRRAEHGFTGGYTFVKPGRGVRGGAAPAARGPPGQARAARGPPRLGKPGLLEARLAWASPASGSTSRSCGRWRRSPSPTSTAPCARRSSSARSVTTRSSTRCRAGSSAGRPKLDPTLYPCLPPRAAVATTSAGAYLALLGARAYLALLGGGGAAP